MKIRDLLEQFDSYDPKGRNQWDNTLEYNWFRLNKQSAGMAFFAWHLEAAGDIWRELTGVKNPDKGYINRKINILKYGTNSHIDWENVRKDMEIYKKEFDEVKQNILLLEPTSDIAKYSKFILRGIVTFDPNLIELGLNKISKFME